MRPASSDLSSCHWCGPEWVRVLTETMHICIQRHKGCQDQPDSLVEPCTCEAAHSAATQPSSAAAVQVCCACSSIWQPKSIIFDKVCANLLSVCCTGSGCLQLLGMAQGEQHHAVCRLTSKGMLHVLQLRQLQQHPFQWTLRVLYTCDAG
jgi:hypothetical protein